MNVTKQVATQPLATGRYSRRLGEVDLAGSRP